jgi:hypothetical protein
MGGGKCDERCFEAIVFFNREEGDSTEGVERKSVYIGSVSLRVDLRDSEGGRVQHIDTICYWEVIAYLKWQMGANADLRTGNTKIWRHRRSSRCELLILQNPQNNF